MDLRLPTTYPTRLTPPPTDNPFFEPPEGPLVVPGSYSVSFEKRVDGVLQPFGTTQSFVVESLGRQTLKATDASVLLAFQKKTARLQRAVLGAIETTEEAQNRLKAAKKALDDTPGADPTLATEARRIERALDELMIGLRGDRVMASRNTPTPMSTVDRVEVIVGAQWSRRVKNRPFQGVLKSHI